MVRSGVLQLFGFVVMMVGNIIILITLIPSLQVIPAGNSLSELAFIGALMATIGYLIMLWDVYGGRIRVLPVYRGHKKPYAI
jgi:Na+/melibiose symporter-like transporter